MGAFPALPLGRRPILSRLLAVYRLSPEVLARLLPEGLVPRTNQGYAVGTACYTRLGSAALLPRGNRKPAGGSDHLAYRFSVQRADGSPAAWVARRETSSWLEARCGAKLLRREYGRSSFQVCESAFGLELAVHGERGEEFYLRGEAAPGTRDSLFAGPQALEDFLGEGQPVRPYDVFAPEADELDLAEHFAPEPLAIFEARSAFLGPGAQVEATIDSAWRVVTRRAAFDPGRRAFRALGAPGTQALPTT